MDGVHARSLINLVSDGACSVLHRQRFCFFFSPYVLVPLLPCLRFFLANFYGRTWIGQSVLRTPEGWAVTVRSNFCVVRLPPFLFFFIYAWQPPPLNSSVPGERQRALVTSDSGTP